MSATLAERKLVERAKGLLMKYAEKLIETVFGDGRQHGVLRQSKLRELDKVGSLFALALERAHSLNAVAQNMLFNELPVEG